MLEDDSLTTAKKNEANKIHVKEWISLRLVLRASLDWFDT